MVPQHPRSTLFPYTTLFRSSPKSDGRRCKPGAVSGHSLRIDQLSRRLYDVVRTQGVRMGKIQDLYETRVRPMRSEEHTSELQSQSNLVCRLLLEKKKHTLKTTNAHNRSTITWSGIATTATSLPAGCSNKTSSTSLALLFSPQSRLLSVGRPLIGT